MDFFDQLLTYTYLKSSSLSLLLQRTAGNPSDNAKIWQANDG